jgi:ribosomal protection tetracycline resistance protein
MSSTGEDFRKLTPLVVVDALKQARTIVCEPIHRFHLELPAETLGSVLPVLAQARAAAPTRVIRGSWCTLEGDIAAAHVHQLRQRLPALTRGEGVMESSFDRYERITGPAPTRPRWDDNPLNRKEYLLRVARRATYI